MAGKYEINQEVQQRDHGKIFLYQRIDHKNPRWQTRIGIDGSSKLIRASTKTKDKTKAWQKAIEIYQTYVDTFRATGSANPKTFNDVIEEWIANLKKDEQQSAEKISEFQKRLEINPAKFWNGKLISSFQESDLIDYVDWRKTSGKRAVKPSTVRRDLVPLKLLFKFAYGRNYTDRPLQFKNIQVVTNRRPSFEDEEWRELITKLDEWVELVRNKHKRHFRSRVYLKFFVLILGLTGIRPGTESRSIRWKSIKREFMSSQQRQAWVIHIPEGKRGPRSIVLSSNLDDHINALKAFRKKELLKKGVNFDVNEPIFCNEGGTPIKSFKKGLKSFLEQYGLLEDEVGRCRVPYSLRHSYATRMINNGKSHWALAAYLGTSVALLEKYYVHNNYKNIGDKIADVDSSDTDSVLSLGDNFPSLDEMMKETQEAIDSLSLGPGKYTEPD